MASSADSALMTVIGDNINSELQQHDAEIGRIPKIQMCQHSSSPSDSGSRARSTPIGNRSRRRDDIAPTKQVMMPPPSKKQKQPAYTSLAAPSTRTKSIAWECFEVCTDIERAARCKYCGKVYSYHVKGTGTSNLKAHVETCKEYAKVRIAADSNQQVIGGGGGGGNKVLTKRFNQEEFRKALVEMIVLDELPFSHVEGHGFRLFCSKINPSFVVPSRRTIARDILKMYREEKAKLKSIFRETGQRVSLTTGIWTSIHKNSYMVVTAHFIDTDWQLHRRILSFSPMTNHKGESSGKVLESVLKDWGIERLMTVTVDNASANEVAVTYLRRKLSSQKVDALPLADQDVVYVRCCCHILNLIVSDGLKELKNNISSIRNAVEYVRSSPSRMQSFQGYVQSEKIDFKGSIMLDIPNRWDSTFLMLTTALNFQSVFDRMADEDELYKAYFAEEEDGNRRIGPPVIEDWEYAQTFVTFLKTFYDVTDKLSDSLTLTSNIFLPVISKVYSLLNKCARSHELLLGQMAVVMKQKYDNYWESNSNINKLLIVSAILDPRCKLKMASRCFGVLLDNDSTKVEELKRESREFLVKLFDIYNVWYNNHAEDRGATSGSGNKASQQSCGLPVLQNSSLLFLSLQADDIWEEHIAEQEALSQGQTEVDRYLMDKCESLRDSNFDVLQWWKYSSEKYPVLAKVAQDVLAIPVSAVASEAAFITGGRVLDAFRSSLTPTMVEALICMQNWIRSSLKAEKENGIEAMVLEAEYHDKLEAEYRQMTQTCM